MPQSEPPAADAAAPPLSARDVRAAPSRSDQRFLLAVSATILALTAAHLWSIARRGGETVELDRIASRQYEFQIDIEEATWVEWMQLPMIGETMARRIVADREENGPFGSPEALLRVPGIGPATLESLRPYLRQGPDAATDSPETTGRLEPSAASRRAGEEPPSTLHRPPE